MSKYYRVIKETPYWEAGAIIEGNDDEYRPVNDLHLKDIKGLSETNYIEDYVVENQPEWFQRVYKVNILKQTKYLAKDAARKMHDDIYKGDK